MRRLALVLIMVGGVTAALAASGLAGGATSRHGSDGSIAFMRPGKVGDYDIWTVRPDATGLRRLTVSPEGQTDYNPEWSPDGSRVLFERRNEAGDDLYTVRGDGTGLHRIYDCGDDCWSDNEGTWSSDGRRIAFSRATGPRSVGHPSKVAIYVMNADGSAISEISTPEPSEEDHYPTWSPDGRTIVFMRNFHSNPVGTKLMAVDVATGAERVVYSFPDWAPGAGLPKFSPDGKLILFTYWCVIALGDDCPQSTRSARNDTLATIRPDGTGLRRLRLPVLADSGSWSPDGQQIAFRCQLRPHVYHLCTSRLDGSGLRKFPWPSRFPPAGSVHPDWGTRS